MIQYINDVLDVVWLGLITPVASWAGNALEALLLSPMKALHFPLALQIGIIGALTALLSLAIKKALKVEKKEAWYLEEIRLRKEAQEEARKGIPDWKVKEVLQNASDSDIDEIYNTYISKKFAWFGCTYLIPIFLTLFWLDTRSVLEGTRFVVEFEHAPFGLPGLSIPLVFFSGYLLTVFLYGMVRRYKGPLGQSTIKHIEITRQI